MCPITHNASRSFSLSLVVGLTVAAIAAGAVASPSARAADGDPSTSNLLSEGTIVPYEGFLMLDGSPMTGQHTLQFDLWDDPSASGAGNLRYSETQEVTFYNGRFSVGLGAGTQLSSASINDAVLDGDRLFLGIRIRNDAGDFVALSGRQRIEAVPFAAWSANAASLNVAGQVRAGSANIAGNVAAGSVSTSGRVSAGSADVSGTVTAGGFTTSGNLNAASASIGTVQVTNPVGTVRRIQNTAGDLYLSGHGGSAPGFVVLEGPIEFRWWARSDYDVHFPNNVRSSCTWTAWHGKADTTPGNNQLICGSDRFVAGIDFTHQAGQDYTYQEQFRLYCCEI